MRDEFTQKTKLSLQQRVGNCCSNPDCRRKTTGPNSDHNKASSIGVACHITAAAQNGPRFDEDLSSEDRKSILNGIWLCQSCAKMIDSDVGNYPVELLYDWKHRSEAIAEYEYEGREAPPELLYQGYSCPFCETFVKEGITFCKGCQADICYGLTPKERMDSAKSWGMLGLICGMILFVFLPQLLNGVFGYAVDLFFGAGFFALIFTAVCSFSLMLFMPIREHKNSLKKPPRFFKSRAYELH